MFDNKFLSKEFLRNLILYGIIGVTAASLDFGVFYLLNTFLQINEFLANFVGIHCGVLLSFFLNSRYNFKKTRVYPIIQEARHFSQIMMQAR